MDTPETPEKMAFPRMVRDLRIKNSLKQREVAEHLHLAISSYGNVECNNFKTMRLDRVKRLISLYQLDPAEAAALVAAWEELPVSKFNQSNKSAWQKRDALKSKVKALRKSMIELIGVLVPAIPDPETLCTCEFGQGEDTACEICTALQLLGLQGWTGYDRVMADLEGVRAAQDGAPA